MDTSEIASIEGVARRARAEYLGKLFAAGARRIVAFGRSLRELARACSNARLRHKG